MDDVCGYLLVCHTDGSHGGQQSFLDTSICFSSEHEAVTYFFHDQLGYEEDVPFDEDGRRILLDSLTGFGCPVTGYSVERVNLSALMRSLQGGV